MVHVIEGSKDDAAEIIFQLQTIMGTRVDDISPTAFCMSNGNLEHVSLSGDYLKNSITGSAAVASQGTITKSDDEEDYAPGATVTLTAVPAEGFVFDVWTDGVTTAARTIVAIGQPQHYIAKFKAAPVTPPEG